jgi:hypothetical protein
MPFNPSNPKAISETFPFLWMGTAVVSAFKSQCKDTAHNFYYTLSSTVLPWKQIRLLFCRPLLVAGYRATMKSI